MAKKETERVALQRGERQRRRFKWWLVPLILVAVLIVAGVVWINWRKIAGMFEPRATLPPEAQVQEDRPGVLYATDFEDPAALSDWELFDDGIVSAYAEEGRLIVDVNALTDTGTWSGLNLTFDDFVLDVRSAKLDGPDDNGIIVIFRLTDPENYNRFDISSDGYYSVSQVRDGEPSIVSDWNLSSAIATGEGSNVIRVRAVADTFSFEVNGVLLPLCVSYEPGVQPLWDPSAGEPACLGGDVVDSWQNGDLMRGKIGLGAQGFTGYDGENVTAAVAVIGFDDLVIWSPDAPEVQ